MDDLDRQLLNRLQSDFPLTSAPYQLLGEELGLNEAEVLERIGRLKEQGIIRRIGASFNSNGLGYVSSLIALKVPEEQLATVASVVNSYPGVTHNYQRNHAYNLWFTLIAPSSAELMNTLKEIQTKIGDLPYLNLPARRVFKIKAQFSF
ncbi:MAG: Lrp/AsnC family transcriptional regulator [Syntrophomonadaceae bacterium]|nr:Lrp/AsnC family transcriptional regulator [Syntrophomonadaceae bacterium]